ncbi:MAG TPA: transposase [Candidatus Saccharimonadales bacterium]|jgi:transposase-like protein|nr:transposase [Candidatus Saccharimonadales bacterium]
MAQYISDDKKKEIIRQIRDEGKKATEVASANGISTKTIYNWLRSGVSGDSSALEISRLKREVEMLYGLLGKLTAEASRSKK